MLILKAHREDRACVIIVRGVHVSCAMRFKVVRESRDCQAVEALDFLVIVVVERGKGEFQKTPVFIDEKSLF